MVVAHGPTFSVRSAALMGLYEGPVYSLAAAVSLAKVCWYAGKRTLFVQNWL